MKSRLKTWPLVLLLSLLSATVAAAQRVAPEEKGRFRELQMKFVCQCGCNYNLLHCPHLVCPSAPVMREAILAGMRTGNTEEEIVASMVGRFGQVALAEPPAEGFNLVGWVMPFAALLAGLILLLGIVKAWRKRAPETSSPGNTALMEKYKGAIEREMKELEE